MNILLKFKETVISVLPIALIVLILGVTVAKIPALMLIRFAICSVLLIIGLTIFLIGVDLGIQPMGERCGAELTKKRSLTLLLSCAMVIGFLVTVAEPDIQVFGDQVRAVFASVNKWVFVFVIAGGVGLFLMAGLLRTVLNFPLKILLLCTYVALFALMFFTPESFVGVAFDSGGATTGPMTVPFILALGLGVSSVRQGDNESFGLTGVTSVGPVMAVLIYGLVLNLTGALNSSDAAQAAEAGKEIAAQASLFAPIVQVIPSVLKEAALSILPLLFLFAVFQVTLFKMSRRQVIRLVIGFIYSFIGLTVFLVSVNGGFSLAGRELGVILGQKAFDFGGGWFALLICTGLLLGAVVVCAEPAVWVLTEQVETVSGGTIKRKMLLVFLSVGAAIAIGLSMLRAVKGFSLKWILVPGYAIALILMIFSPSLFTGIAFDSGGVASGPITSTFVLSFTLGAASGGTGNGDAFGVIALVAMTPLIAIQILGIIYEGAKKRENSKNKIGAATNIPQDNNNSEVEK